MIQAWVESGRVFDLVLAVLVLEGVALALYRRRTGRGLPPAILLPFLLSGGFLIAAFRAATLGAAWLWVALLLSLAFATHLLELRDRWRAVGTGTSSGG